MRFQIKIATFLIICGYLSSCSKSDTAPPVIGTDAFVRFLADGNENYHLQTYATYKDNTLIITSSALLAQSTYQMALEAKLSGTGIYTIDEDGNENGENWLALTDADANEGHYITGNGHTVELNVTAISESKQKITGYFSGEVTFKSSNGGFNDNLKVTITEGSFLVYYF